MTEEEDKISVYGNWNIIYVLSNRVHATRYSYQFPIGQVMPEIMDEYMKDLQEELPKILVIMSGKFDDNIHGFLDKNNYHIENITFKASPKKYIYKPYKPPKRKNNLIKIDTNKNHN